MQDALQQDNTQASWAAQGRPGIKVEMQPSFFYQANIWIHSIWHETFSLTHNWWNRLVLSVIEVQEYASLCSYDIL